MLSLRAFEVEGVHGKGEEAVIDVDILPNRAHDCLSHRGVAGEISAIYGFELKAREVPEAERKGGGFFVEVEDVELCRRYVALPVSNVRVGPSAEWLRKRLESIGERPINNIVDITNFVMFDTGQPLHAFDRDKIKGDKIYVRLARKGESMITLDGNEIMLNGTELIIADEDSVLALAGIKGGKKAEVDENTENIVLEAASFDPVCVRRTSRRINILTESSKRFENDPSPEYALHSAEFARKLICDNGLETDPGSKKYSSLISIGKTTDIYPFKVPSWTVSFPLSEIKATLGSDVPAKEVSKILERLRCKVAIKGEMVEVEPPKDRVDLKIPEDVIEEVGRIYGYEKLKPVDLRPVKGRIDINKRFYYQARIRLCLTKIGFSEIFTYSVGDMGAVELENPLTSDRRYLRNELSTDMKKALVFNERNIELVGEERVRLFEIANVFTPKEEKTHLTLGVKNTKKKQKPGEEELVVSALEEISTDLGPDLKKIGSFVSGNVWECCLDEVLNELPQPEEWDIFHREKRGIKYQPISPYPFVLRDIAVFVPANVGDDQVREVIKSNAGDLLKNVRLFDVYEKIDDKGGNWRSYAFRLVFVSHERTLSDSEVNKVMDVISSAVNSHDEWSVR